MSLALKQAELPSFLKQSLEVKPLQYLHFAYTKNKDND